MPISSFFDYPEGESVEKDDTPTFLAHWGDDEWDALLAHVKVKTFKAGEVVLAAGDKDPSLYLLGEGRLEVLGAGKGPGRRLALLWGVHCVVTQDARDLDDMVSRACRFAFKDGFAKPGQRIIVGTRKPPSQLVAFSPRNGVLPPSGQLITSAPLSVV